MKGLLLFGLVGILGLLGGSTAFGQLDSIGGPYTPDSHTILLLHFDGDLTNQGVSPNAQANGNPSAFFYVPSPLGTGMGQALRIQNDNTQDSAYIHIKDTSTLSLTGDWTIEGWVNIFTFGAVAGGWNWVPRLVIKPGDAAFWQPNYFVEMWGDVRKFSCGYYDGTYATIPGSIQWANWPQANSPDNSFDQGVWVHLTFIRDSQRRFVATLVHDQNRQLLFYSTYFYDTTYQGHVTTNSQDVYVGWAGTPTDPSVDSWLDGFVDEIRISDVMRNFPVPPIIHTATLLLNQKSTDVSYPVDATIEPFIAGATITSAVIHYNAGAGWVDAPLTSMGNKLYSGAIPGMAVGTRVRYYVVAQDNYGLRSIYPSTAEFDPATQYSFAVYEPNSQTLHLTFEEGPGVTPSDHSAYNESITAFRIPDYSTDAKQGTYSLLLQNNPSKIDSNWLEVDPTFVGGDEFSVNFWFNADSIKQNTVFLNLPRDSTTYDYNNYEIRLTKKPLGSQVTMQGRYTRRGTTSIVTLESNTTPQTGLWYHVIFERSQANKTAALALYDASDVLITKVSKVDSLPIVGGSRLRVGRAATSPANYYVIPPFRGRLDDIAIFNYPASGITGVNEQGGLSIPHEFVLEQNYPNPFNPTTMIRFSLPRAGALTLVVFDLLGRQVRMLVNGSLHAGEHRVQWDGRDDAGRPVSTGVYFYALKGEDRTAIRKMVLVR